MYLRFNFFFSILDYKSEIDETGPNNTQKYAKEDRTEDGHGIHYTNRREVKRNSSRIDNNDLSVLLGDLCLFGCLWCPFEDTSYHSFCRHVKDNHKSKVPIDLLQNDCESYAKRLTLTKCKICQLSLPHDSYSISKHVQREHTVQKSSFSCTIFDYVAINKQEHIKSDEPDISLGKKCFVAIKFSNYVQHIKDKINMPKVQSVTREKFGIIKSLRQIFFGGRNLPVEATFEIGNLCLFYCPWCKLDFDNSKKMFNHVMKDCVRQRRRKGTNGLVRSCILEARYHRCRVCNAILLCDIMLIKKHISFYHDMMSIEKYMSQTLSSPKIYCNGIMPMLDYKFKSLMLSNLERSHVPKAAITIMVSNKCLFKCDKCEKVHSSMFKFKLHLLECKGNSKFQKNHVVEAVFYDCKICGTRMICDKEPINRHVYFVHGMTLTKYMKHQPKNKALYIPKTAENISKSGRQVILPDDMPEIPAVPPLKRASNPKNSLPDHLTTEKVGNFCVFACDKCQFKSASWGSMRNHNRHAVHGPRSSKYNTKYIKEARYHKCVVCGGIIISDVSIIKTHVNIMHGYNLDQYLDCCSKSKNSTTGSTRTKKDSLVKVPQGNVHTKSPEIFSDKLLNLCTFKCDKCSTTSVTWYKMQQHLRSHQAPVLFDKKYVLMPVYHKCKVCGKKLLCDKYFIRAHLFYKHKLNSKTYAVSIGSKLYQPKCKIRLVTNEESKEVAIYIFSASLSKSHKEIVIPAGTIDERYMASNVENLCIFKCPRCNIKANSWVEMSSHLAEMQHSDAKTSCFHSDYIHEAVYHKCYVCGQGVLCDEDLIRRHLRNKHRIICFKKYLEYKDPVRL